MPALQSRQQVLTEELNEFPITGPFGGIQSELPATEIEQLGFVDSTNVIFRKGVAYVRPSFTALPNFPVSQEPVLAIPSFYNKNGVQIQAVLTPTRLLQWIGGNWTPITGPAFTGSASQLFSWDVVGQQLCFSQGADKIFLWDGVAATYASSSASAPAALYMAEIALHLVAL